MHLVYLDEVKYQEEVEPYYWLCGLAFPWQSIRDVESRLSEISSDYFGTAVLSKDNEFHAREIVHGKGPYKGHEIGKRVELYKALIDVIDNCPELGRIKVRIDPSKMIADKIPEKAFMFFVEKVNSLMRTLKSLAMLISDHDKDMISINVANLSNYKQYGTEYQFGTDIEYVVDTIHHTHSHHSRLIQLADIYTYSMALCPKGNLNYPRSELLEYVKTKNNVMSPSKYKYWPTDQSWHKPLTRHST